MARMRIINGRGAEILKRIILPLAVCLLVLATIPHKFGWIDVGLSAIAVPLAAIAVFGVSCLWEKLIPNKPNSN